MDAFMVIGFLALFLFILIILFITFRIFSTMAGFLTFYALGRNPFRYFAFRYEKPSPGQLRTLEGFSYYRSMPESLKKIFAHRLVRFLKDKKFEGREGFRVNDEVRLQVAACAVQLTFGMTRYRLPHFNTFIIYPDSYLSPLTGRFHLGEVNPSGAIVLSWKSFEEGYADLHDNRNLGLHEMSHALFLNALKGHEEDLRLSFYLEDVKRNSAMEMSFMRRYGKGYLREYAATNMMEFFAVATEHFFEAPNAMKKEMPEFYHSLSKLYGQDPSRWIPA